MLRSLLCMCVFFLSLQAQAENFFKQPGRWFKDTGRAIDQSRLKAQDAYLDIITYGEHGRQRDRNRAKSNETIAVERKRQAEQAAREEEAKRQERKSVAQSHIAFLNDLENSIAGLQAQLKSQGTLLTSMAEELFYSNDGRVALVKLIKSQLENLKGWAENPQLGEFSKAELVEKIKKYTSQVENFPTSTDESVIEDLIHSVLEIYEELELDASDVAKKIDSKITDLQNTIAQIDNPPAPMIENKPLVVTGKISSYRPPVPDRSYTFRGQTYYAP